MASIKVKFRRSTVKDREGSLFYQIIHQRRVRQIYPDLHIRYSEWDGTDIVVPTDCDTRRRDYLFHVKEKLKSDIYRLESIVANYDESGIKYSAEEIALAYRNPAIVADFISFARNLIDEMGSVGKKKTAKRFRSVLSSLTKYIGQRTVAWRDFNSTLISGYEEFLLKRGLCRNTTSYYMRNLRSIANRAVECGYNLPRNPFKHVYTGVDKTIKRALPLRTICRIRDIDLTGKSRLDFARNIFMFSFYTSGMSFVDMAFLKKSDLQNDIIVYRRRKTRQLVQVKVESQIRMVLESLGQPTSSYLLPIIMDDNEEAEQQYLNAYHRVNRHLKKLGKILGLDTKLTMYVARHAWASIARSHNIPIAIISEAMGHDSETTTRIYLNTLDSSSVDRANNKIIKLMGCRLD